MALIGRGARLPKVDKSKMQYAVEIVKPRVFDPPMKVKILKAILAKQPQQLNIRALARKRSKINARHSKHLGAGIDCAINQFSGNDR